LQADSEQSGLGNSHSALAGPRNPATDALEAAKAANEGKPVPVEEASEGQEAPKADSSL
jgi:hypothetical protein